MRRYVEPYWRISTVVKLVNCFIEIVRITTATRRLLPKTEQAIKTDAVLYVIDFATTINITPIVQIYEERIKSAKFSESEFYPARILYNMVRNRPTAVAEATSRVQPRELWTFWTVISDNGESVTFKEGSWSHCNMALTNVDLCGVEQDA